MSANSAFLKKIDDNLTIYRSTRSDSERLARFYSTIFKKSDGSPDESFYAYVDDLLNGKHPTFQEDDFVFIEDNRSGKIVSAMKLISQTWTYGGISIPAGRPETVATDPKYRNRGLVRALFEVVHEWSRQRGELLQGITGILYYYRLFGYEMCVEMEGGWRGTPDSLPAITEKLKESYRIHSAEEKDLPFIASLYRQSCDWLLLACPRPEEIWRGELFVRSPKSGDYRVVWMIESPQNEPLGFFLHPSDLGPDYVDETSLGCDWYTLKPGVSYLEVTPVVLQHLLKTGQEYAATKGKSCTGIGLYLDSGHPAYQVVEQSLPCKVHEYSWYMRIPDMPAFLRKVSPVLENRLEKKDRSLYTQ